MSVVEGYVAPGLEGVRDVLAAQLLKGGRGGSALCVQVGGETVVDLWGGQQDQAGERAWQADTLVNLFSCTKTLTGVAVLMQAQAGTLDLDRPVADYWPAFAAAGKADITLRQVLCHRAGLPGLRTPLPAAALFDWAKLTDTLETEAPWWQPGEVQAYGALTYGWILGEVLGRVTGCEPGRAIIDAVVRPLGLDLHMGLTEAEQARTAFLQRGRNDFGDAVAQALMKAIQSEPESVPARALNNPPGMLASGNRPEWQRCSQPAANAHGSARGLAGFYTALLQGRLLDAQWLAEMTREHSRGPDRTLLGETRFGLGCWLEQPQANASFGLGAGGFGHPGAGGCIGFADPERQVAVAYVTSLMGPYVMMDPRVQALTDPLRQWLAKS